MSSMARPCSTPCLPIIFDRGSAGRRVHGHQRHEAQDSSNQILISLLLFLGCWSGLDTRETCREVFVQNAHFFIKYTRKYKKSELFWKNSAQNAIFLQVKKSITKFVQHRKFIVAPKSLAFSPKDVTILLI